MRFHPGIIAAAASGAAAFDYYVDSVNGSDAYAGTSDAQPKQTLAAAVALLAAGDRLGLARGSHWREQITIADDDTAIGSYGSGAMPVIDGADIVTSGWTQPDAITYPNVWSRSWTRSQAATTGEARMGYWQAGVRTTLHTSLANLQAGANGDWHTTNQTATTVTISIRAAADPNSDGILREITKRAYCILGHGQIIAPHPGQSFTGPIELKRAVEHYNALAMGPGVASRLLLRDGNIHHSVSEGDLTDVVMTEYSPQTPTSMVAFYRSASAGFAPVATRVLGLLPGGASRPLGTSAFYAHGSAGPIDSLTLNGCLGRGVDFANSDAQLLTLAGGYCEDAPTREINCGAANNLISHFLAFHTIASPFPANNGFISTASVSPSHVTTEHCCAYKLTGTGIIQSNTTHRQSHSHNSLVIASSGSQVFGGAPDVRYCVMQGARNYDSILSAYTGDFNVFYRLNNSDPQFGYNGSVYSTLATFQAASGQDANSVYLKHADQVSGNGIAFWLGVATGANAGPTDCDFRINPSAKVYNGAGTGLTGTFADGTTPITMAGAQEHWDFNLRQVVAGPPTRRPVLPTAVAEMRTYLEDPEAWDFYP